MKREALSHPVAIAGVLVTIGSLAVLITLVIAVFAGLLTNPYIGIVVLVALPAFLVIGLVMIAAGARLRSRALARDPARGDWPVVDFRRVDVRRSVMMLAALAPVASVGVLLGGYSTLHWMETPTFCGQACHAPMEPQYAAWSAAPHAQIPCVACHISDGAAGFMEAKLNGVRQLALVATNSYPRPIPPGAKIHPGGQAATCRNCHTPERAVGDRLRVIREYADDETNTESATMLQMHLGAGPGSSSRSIHWHANPAIRIEYVATDPARETIPYVRVTDANGRVKEYIAPDTQQEVIKGGARRVMDCIDCHNTVGHPIASAPERAVDNAIAAGQISRDLPFVRREGVRLLTASHATKEEADRAIDEGLRGFYASRGRPTDQAEVTRSIRALQTVFGQNVFPAMKVTWGSYPDNRGHVTSTGCFRCHDDSHSASDGTTISADCEYCHGQ